MTNDLQQVITSQVAELIIHLLEVIQVQEADDPLFSTLHGFCCMGKGLVKGPLVRQAGERVNLFAPTLVPSKEIPGEQAESGSNDYRRKHDIWRYFPRRAK